jgi:hypothetical protein
MRTIGRICLIVMVAISLVAAGMPFAHAMHGRAAASPAVHETHQHVMSDHAMSDHAMADHAMADHAMPDHAMHDGRHMAHPTDQHQDGGVSAAIDLLNGKTCCSMCAPAYVAPALGQAGVMRIGFMVRYWVLAAFQPDTPAVVDPGIPII